MTVPRENMPSVKNTADSLTDPQIYGLMDQFGTYRSPAMAASINTLRQLQKERLLDMLTRYLSVGNTTLSFSREITVTLLCRLLFVPPQEGWGQFNFGTNPSSINLELRTQFPLFPLAIVRGTPILLVHTFDLYGDTNEPFESLRRAKNLKPVPTDLATAGFEVAAQEFVHSDSFGKLYPEVADRGQMELLILHRAK